MKVIVFTPTTRYGGLDVTHSCLFNQFHHGLNMTWLLADELLEERQNLYQKLRDNQPWFEIQTLAVPKQPGLDRNLASSYQLALEYARLVNADLFISLQDYIWIPRNGINLFANFSKANAHNCLITGLCHHSKYPEASSIHDEKGLFSIFDRPWNGKMPEGLTWHDVRYTGKSAPYIIDPVRWEANWCAISRNILHDEEINFDISYDAGIAYENQDYALKAQAKGAPIYIMEENVAISLPHRSYWPEATKADDALTLVNQKKHHQKWQITMPH